MPFTFDAHSFEALVLDLNQKLEPMSISLRKDAYLRRDAHKETFHLRGRVREGRDMYARAFELNPTNSFVQARGHRFQDAEDVRSVNGVLAATEP
jgi:hypothetical protein